MKFEVGDRICRVDDSTVRFQVISLATTTLVTSRKSYILKTSKGLYDQYSVEVIDECFKLDPAWLKSKQFKSDMETLLNG